MIPTERIVELYSQRRLQRGSVIERMRQISELYEGNIVVPLPEVDKKEPAGVANFLAQGIDAHAMRIASVQPDITFPPEDPSVQRRVNEARTKRRVAYGWYENNAMNLVDRRRARSLIAYSDSPVVIRPGKEHPEWEVRSSLQTYASDGGMTPDDVIFASTRTYGWLVDRYPMQAGVLAQSLGQRGRAKVRPEDLIEVLEYLDGDECVLVATGQGHAGYKVEAEYGLNDATINFLGLGGVSHFALELERTVNLAGMCTAVVPGRITLSEPKGQFDDSVSLFQQMARLMAMEVNAVANAIWPDTWLVSADPAKPARIIKVADGLTGQVGEVQGGDIRTLYTTPGVQTYPTIDRLQENLRITSAMPAQMNGMSASNIRTDRRGQSLLSSAVDFHIQEHQEVLARSKKHELERAIAVDRAYFGSRKKSFYVSFGKENGRADYEPGKLWATDRTVLVDYAMAGSDINEVVTTMGQAVGLSATSRLTAMRHFPWIRDVEGELGQIAAEAIDAAGLSALQQQAASGALTLPDWARIKQLLKTGDTSLEEAVLKVHEEAQRRQASSGPPGTPEAPAAPGSPEAQPGLAQPGQGEEVPTVAPPPAGADNFAQVIAQLARGRAMARSA